MNTVIITLLDSIKMRKYAKLSNVHGQLLFFCVPKSVLWDTDHAKIKT